jgi:2-octaprenylphenol hydroxylase
LAELDHDVAVVGAGMVGAALALALAQRGFSVAVLEAHPPALEWAPESHDLRVSAITRASQHLLQNLGVWSAMAEDRITPYRQMRVWDRAGFGEICFDAVDLGEPDLGHIVENRVIVRALWRALGDQGVAVRAPAQLRVLETGEEGAVLELADRSRLRVGLAVGADGARSQVRALAGIGTRGAPYDQHALVATVSAERGNQAAAWQRFMHDGPLALLPLQRDLFSIVWSTRPEQAAHLCDIAEGEFNGALTEASEARLGALCLVGERAVFPLRQQHAARYVGPALALVGDAAHVIHPLAGQGVNLGFLDAAALVDALLDGREQGRPAGALRDLRAYERSRRGHNTATQFAMDAFKHLFGNDSGPLSLARNLGLGVAGRLTPLRRTFERVALGQGPGLPTLSRPPGPH